MARPRKNPVNPAAREGLRAAGTTLFGDQWHSGLARALQPFHPAGGPVAAVRVTQWYTGERSIPQWVIESLSDAVAAEVARKRAEAAAIEAQCREGDTLSKRLKRLARTGPLDDGPPDDGAPLGGPDDYRPDDDDPAP